MYLKSSLWLRYVHYVQTLDGRRTGSNDTGDADGCR